MIIKLPSLTHLRQKIFAYFISSIVYFFYLLSLTRVVALNIPCLQPNPGESFEYLNCNIALALDRFIVLALIGFASFLIFLYLKRTRLKSIFIQALLLSCITIITYYWYISIASVKISQAPIILDSIPALTN